MIFEYQSHEWYLDNVRIIPNEYKHYNYYDSEEDNDYNLEDCEDYDDYNSEENLGDEDEDENGKGPTYKNLHKPVKANKITKITNTSTCYLYLYFNEIVRITFLNDNKMIL